MDKNRIAAAIKILAEPWNYKVCEGCDSIVTEKTIICPNCKAYRFDDNNISVGNMAKKLAQEEQKSVTEKDLY